MRLARVAIMSSVLSNWPVPTMIQRRLPVEFTTGVGIDVIGSPVPAAFVNCAILVGAG